MSDPYGFAVSRFCFRLRNFSVALNQLKPMDCAPPNLRFDRFRSNISTFAPIFGKVASAFRILSNRRFDLKTTFFNWGAVSRLGLRRSLKVNEMRRKNRLAVFISRLVASSSLRNLRLSSGEMGRSVLFPESGKNRRVELESGN